MTVVGLGQVGVNWLTVLPVQEHGFTLHKTAFHDAIALQYGWDPVRLPNHCPCGMKFSIKHAFSCPKGGFPTIRHNEICDVTASLLTEVCHEVQVESTLQPISGESFDHATRLNMEDGDCLDLSMNGFWGGRCEKSYVDVKVFNPHAPTNRSFAPRAIYRCRENTKKRTYEARIRGVEHGTFTPLVFSATGGMADQAIVFLASLLSEKRNEHYAVVMGWIRCYLSFSLLRSATQCLHGSRSSAGRFSRENPLAAVDFSNEYLHSNTTDTPINQLWTDFKSACHFCLDTLVPSKLSSNKTSNQPWITTYMKRLCRQKKQAYAQYRQSHSPTPGNIIKPLKT